MFINKQEINAVKFAYDGCHKIYILEDKKDIKEAQKLEYTIIPINFLEYVYKNSCELRFISNWKLTKTYAAQFEKCNFEKRKMEV